MKNSLTKEDRAVLSKIGSLGGKARFKKLTKAEKSEIGKKTVKARWDKKSHDSDNN